MMSYARWDLPGFLHLDRWEKDDITAATETAARRISNFIFNK